MHRFYLFSGMLPTKRDVEKIVWHHFFWQFICVWTEIIRPCCIKNFIKKSTPIKIFTAAIQKLCAYFPYARFFLLLLAYEWKVTLLSPHVQNESTATALIIHLIYNGSPAINQLELVPLLNSFGVLADYWSSERFELWVNYVRRRSPTLLS